MAKAKNGVLFDPELVVRPPPWRPLPAPESANPLPYRARVGGLRGTAACKLLCDISFALPVRSGGEPERAGEGAEPRSLWSDPQSALTQSRGAAEKVGVPLCRLRGSA